MPFAPLPSLIKVGPSGLLIPPPFGSPVASYQRRPLGIAPPPRDGLASLSQRTNTHACNHCPRLALKAIYPESQRHAIPFGPYFHKGVMPLRGFVSRFFPPGWRIRTPLPFGSPATSWLTPSACFSERLNNKGDLPTLGGAQTNRSEGGLFRWILTPL